VSLGLLAGDFSRSLSDIPHSIALLWTSDQLVAEMKWYIKCCAYLIENTVRVHYRDKIVNAVEGNN
jgi:hypothetical protein